MALLLFSWLQIDLYILVLLLLPCSMASGLSRVPPVINFTNPSPSRWRNGSVMTFYSVAQHVPSIWVRYDVVQLFCSFFFLPWATTSMPSSKVFGTCLLAIVADTIQHLSFPAILIGTITYQLLSQPLSQ